MDDALRLSTHRAGGTLTIVVAGALDLATAPQLLAYLETVFTQLPNGVRGNGQRGEGAAIDRLVIDGGNVSFIDARGLGVLVTIKNLAGHHRLPLLLADISTPIHRLLTITDMHRHFSTSSAPPSQ
ncbi:STAS domain-containing protein [Spirillospora sp. NPDC047279]|uniref:STAS domain-containing protein n=1 Tax=Spirillospora sp. NPDC047279 TaxID=3155478 RepID=UPI0033EEE295